MSDRVIPPLAAIQPLFICLGVPKAATTWIHRQLEAHPDIGVTPSKEINYWSVNYDKGPGWYRKQFPNDRHYEIYAEVSVGYLREEPLARLASGVPGSRFMVSLRNPYERSWSSYWQSIRTGVFEGTLAEAIDALPKIIEDSLYSPGLDAFFEHFDREQLHVALYDDLREDPYTFIHDIYAFAGVDSEFVPPGLGQAINVGRRHSVADEAMARVQTMAKKAGLRRRHLMNLGLWSSLERAYSRLASNRPIPSLSEPEWRVLDGYLRPELTRLEGQLDRDLDFWRRLA